MSTKMYLLVGTLTSFPGIGHETSVPAQSLALETLQEINTYIFQKYARPRAIMSWTE